MERDQRDDLKITWSTIIFTRRFAGNTTVASVSVLIIIVKKQWQPVIIDLLMNYSSVVRVRGGIAAAGGRLQTEPDVW